MAATKLDQMEGHTPEEKRARFNRETRLCATPALSSIDPYMFPAVLLPKASAVSASAEDEPLANGIAGRALLHRRSASGSKRSRGLLIASMAGAQVRPEAAAGAAAAPAGRAQAGQRQRDDGVCLACHGCANLPCAKYEEDQ